MNNDPFSIRNKALLRHAFAFLGGAPTVQPPPPRNLTQEMLQTYGGYAATAPGYLNLNQTYQPQYGQLDLNLLQQQLFGYSTPQGGPTTTQIQTPQFNKKGKIIGFQTQSVPVAAGQQPGTTYPGTVALGAEAATKVRESDLADVAKLGPQAVQAYLSANPYLAGALNQLQAATGSPIMQTLNQQALQQLQAGGQLTPQEADALAQQTRAGFSERGMVGGNQALGAELLNRDVFQRQRMQQAQQFATGVQQLDTDTAGRAAQIYQQTLADPYQAILGRASGAGILGGYGGGGGGVGAGQAIATANSLFNPMSPYAQDLYNTNYNAQAAANIANANYQSAQNAGQLGLAGAGLAAAGTVGAALI